MTDQWEHLGLLLSTTFKGGNIDKMSEPGQDGWELVAVGDGVAYMKRRVGSVDVLDVKPIDGISGRSK